ncbi:hypothetical protein [Brevibacillus agri]|uniref:hypothetical protein n=1 Tax=Brevibacillus agri TaxID=51101 RepID=UPI003D1DA352
MLVKTAYERHELPAPWLTCRDAAVFFRLIAVHGLERPKRDAQKHALASADSNRRGDWPLDWPLGGALVFWYFGILTLLCFGDLVIW